MIYWCWGDLTSIGLINQRSFNVTICRIRDELWRPFTVPPIGENMEPFYRQSRGMMSTDRSQREWALRHTETKTARAKIDMLHTTITRSIFKLDRSWNNAFWVLFCPQSSMRKKKEKEIYARSTRLEHSSQSPEVSFADWRLFSLPKRASIASFMLLPWLLFYKKKKIIGEEAGIDRRCLEISLSFLHFLSFP